MQRGWQVQILTSGKPGLPSCQAWGPSGQIWRSPVIHDSRLGRLARRTVFVFWALARLCAMEFDALHIYALAGIEPWGDAFAARLATWIARRKRARSVWVHCLADNDLAALDLRGWNGGAKRYFCESFDTLVGVSPVLVDSLRRVWPQKAVYLPYGVRDDLFLPASALERAGVRRSLGACDEDVIFVFLGSVGTRKGFDLLARSFIALSATHPDWKLWVIGPRSQAENRNLLDGQIAALTQDLEAYPQVRFLGRIDDRQQLAGLIAAGDVFVFPSRREGMGIAPIEAMSCGLPAIIARLPGITDLANIEGETGLYISPASVPELKRAMVLLGENSSLRHHMGAAARRRVLASFSWRGHLDRWERLYSGQDLETEFK